MSKKTIDALRRSDRAIVGAILLVLATAVAHAAIVPYTDRIPARDIRAASIRAANAVNETGAVETQVATAQLVVERQCLAQAMYYEARGEGVEGEKAVAEVVFHRMRSHAFPSTVCGVVFEGAHKLHACQFSFACNGDLAHAKEQRAWAEARLLAAKIMTGAVPLGDITEHAISYHAVYVEPDWSGSLVRTVQIGNHIFYRAVPRSRSS